MPAGFSFVTNMSNWPALAWRKAPAVVGKSLEGVSPTTYALPDPSTATPRGESVSVPPR